MRFPCASEYLPMVEIEMALHETDVYLGVRAHDRLMCRRVDAIRARTCRWATALRQSSASQSRWIPPMGSWSRLPMKEPAQRAASHSRKCHIDQGVSGRHASVPRWCDACKAGLEGCSVERVPGSLRSRRRHHGSDHGQGLEKNASTGGWGFGRFIDGKPVEEAQHKTCFPCHEAGGEGARLGLHAMGTLNPAIPRPQRSRSYEPRFDVVARTATGTL